MKNKAILFNTFKLPPSIVPRHHFNIYIFYLVTIIVAILMA